jgi:CubicO group peptidase (beta-lactamase class C family)
MIVQRCSRRAVLAGVMTAGALPGACASLPPRSNGSLASSLIYDAKQALEMNAGTAVIAMDGDRIAYEEYFGYAEIAGARKVDANTAFYIASLTKPVFATAVLSAESQGRIDTKTTLAAMFPDVEMSQLRPDDVSVAELLSHSMGFDNILMEWLTAYVGTRNPADFPALVAASMPNATGGLGQFSYSNVGYNITSDWLDRELGRSWQSAIDELAFEPLGMDRTTAYASVARDWPLAAPYSVHVANGQEEIYLGKSDETMHAAGGIIATARDVARFVIAHLNEGRIGGEQALPANVIAKSHEVLSTRGECRGYAWGWFVDGCGHDTVFSHTGGYAGASALMSFKPSERKGLVVLHNEGGFRANNLNSMISDAVYRELGGESDDAIRADFEARRDALAERTRQAQAERIAMAAERSALRLNLSLPRSAYLGDYMHPLGGRINVAGGTNDDFLLRWGHLRSVGRPHADIDTLLQQFKPGNFDPLRFELDGDRVVALRLAEARFEKATP